MKRNFSGLMLLLCSAALTGGIHGAATQSIQGARTPLDARRTLGSAHSFRNLTLIPVYDQKARAGGNYITLDEGLKSRAVHVQEAKGGGQVNTLFITNDGDRPVYIMGGEVVLGGQQDRCLARDTVVPPGKQRIPITVFCVEHGRWSGHGEFDATARAVASASIRQEAQNADFVALGGVARPASASPSPPEQTLSRRQSGAVSSRGQSAVGEAQQKVWEKVAAKNKKFDVAPASGTYRTLLNMEGGGAGKSIQPYLKEFANFAGDPHAVGFVAAINGKIVAADIFGDPGLFRKLRDKLLRAYAADAAEAASERGAETRQVSVKEARTFLTAARTGGKRAENRSESATNLRQESGQAVRYQLSIPARAAHDAVDGKCLPTLVHENLLRK